MHEERLVGGAQYNGVVIPRKESYTYANTPILKESGVSYYNKTKKKCAFRTLGTRLIIIFKYSSWYLLSTRAITGLPAFVFLNSRVLRLMRRVHYFKTC